ncbi:MAG TPA: cytochrome c [Vicinamibacteria bacterium]
MNASGTYQRACARCHGDRGQGGIASSDGLPPLPAGATRFVVGVALSEIAISPKLVDSTLPTKSRPGAAPGRKSGREP